ncbi:MAG: hypothetical protein AAFV90_06505 [Cyanobacteria bacterium J06634_5]
MASNKNAADIRKLSLHLADTSGDDVLRGRAGNDVISARNGNDRLNGNAGDDLLISYSDAGEPAVLGKQVVNKNEPLKASNDRLRGGAGADTFMWINELDAKPKFLKKHTQKDGRIDGANNALAGENNNSHDHWVESIGDDVVADFNLEQGDKIVIKGHTAENYKIEKKGNSFILSLRSNQGNADQNNPNGAHDGDLIGTIKLRGAAAKYSEQQIRNAIDVTSKVNYVADGRGLQVVDADTTANRSGTANGEIRIQAEDMILDGSYKTETVKGASGKEVISLKGGGNEDVGTAYTRFKGASGKYDIKIGYYDESDGVGKLELSKGKKKAQQKIASFDLDQSLGSNFPNEKTFTTRTISGVDLMRGERISLTGYENGSPKTAEHARVDYIEFVPSGGAEPPVDMPIEPPVDELPEIPQDLPSSALSLADTEGSDQLVGSTQNDVISARNGNDKLMGNDGDDLLISYSDAGEPAVLGKQVVNKDEPLKASSDTMTGGAGADVFMWGMEIDAKQKFLKKHTQKDGRINGANNALAGENNNSHDHWLESIGDDVVTDFNLKEGDKIVISGHTVDNYSIEEKGDSFVLNLRSNQGNADQNNPNGAHDGDLVGTIKLNGAAAQYSETQIRKATTLNKMVNYVADGRGIEVIDADTTANQSGIAMGNMRIQAEDMALTGAYKTESAKVASGGSLISLRGGPNDETGTASFKFEGDTGNYQVKVAYFDENDGIGKIELMQQDELLMSVDMDQELGSRLPDEKTLTSFSLPTVAAKSGDIFTFKGYENGSPQTAEHGRIDYIEFIPMGNSAMPTNGTNKPMEMAGSMNTTTATMPADSELAIAGMR